MVPVQFLPGLQSRRCLEQWSPQDWLEAGAPLSHTAHTRLLVRGLSFSPLELLHGTALVFSQHHRASLKPLVLDRGQFPLSGDTWPYLKHCPLECTEGLLLDNSWAAKTHRMDPYNKNLNWLKILIGVEVEKPALHQVTSERQEAP